MRKLPLAILFLAVLQTAGMAQSKQTRSRIPAETFLVDRSKPYVYLQVDHIGPGKPQREGEPKQRIWLRLHNNCIVPITVDMFGNDSIFDNVVANRFVPLRTNQVPTYPMPPNVAKALGFRLPKSTPHPKASIMPPGYGMVGDVGSSETLGPGESIYFSIPINQVSSKWHVEFPFGFVLDVRSELEAPEQFISLYQEDVAAKTAGSGPQ